MPATPSQRTTAATDLEDMELVRRIGAGDRSAFEALYLRHAKRLFAIALLLVRSRHDAEDLVHDVLLEAWRAAATFDPARGRVTTWLAVRMRSRCFDRRRVRRTRPTLRCVEMYVEAGQSSAPDVARVRAALATLAPERRRVVELAYFHGLSRDEIATQLAVPVGTVKSRYATGMRLLRKQVDRRCAA